MKECEILKILFSVIDVDKNDFEMPTIKGTKEQQLQFAAFVTT